MKLVKTDLDNFAVIPMNGPGIGKAHRELQLMERMRGDVIIITHGRGFHVTELEVVPQAASGTLKTGCDHVPNASSRRLDPKRNGPCSYSP